MRDATFLEGLVQLLIPTLDNDSMIHWTFAVPYREFPSLLWVCHQ